MADPAAVLLAASSTIAAAVGMLFFKLAAKQQKLLSPQFIAGGILFVLGTVLMILALQKEELSLLFPITSLTYIWVMLLSWKFLGEKINRWKVASVVFIILGITFAVQ
ncbi:MAG: EamA family transporter [Candidatus Aenigmarchaeota archaeon]|nr:EamA family transporter [Candidatus Aenigmarchaeota archaeon]